ncbi:MarR family winged helix-turn-helix transcriptional regulator [Govanella unica]|uniref:Winged helix DNA-binding protein n=1 Tax=Govanella unica TaxID=2975056 RepID=A0A9X3TYK3_9PROT|nr:winged helix DNA-binding protein [Govania unica]MDA5194080.1 winged helix DNA-binding protein [Govania unica]
MAIAAKSSLVGLDETPQGQIKGHFLESLRLVERLHRRLLDIVKMRLDETGRTEINSVQALLLYNIGDNEMTAGELRTRGYYLGSNVSYNLKKLVEMDYIEHERSEHDRRSVRIRLSDKGRDVKALVVSLFDEQLADALGGKHMTPEDMKGLRDALRGLERYWSEQINYATL